MALKAGDVVRRAARAGDTLVPLLVYGLVADDSGRLRAELFIRLPGGAPGSWAGCLSLRRLRPWDTAKDGPLA